MHFCTCPKVPSTRSAEGSKTAAVCRQCFLYPLGQVFVAPLRLMAKRTFELTPHTAKQAGRAAVRSTTNFAESPHMPKAAWLLRIHHLFRLAVSHPQLSQMYCRELLGIARAMQCRLDPAMKHAICASCYVILLPGATCDVAVRRGAFAYRCRHCGRRSVAARLRRRAPAVKKEYV